MRQHPRLTVPARSALDDDAKPLVRMLGRVAHHDEAAEALPRLGRFRVMPRGPRTMSELPVSARLAISAEHEAIRNRRPGPERLRRRREPRHVTREDGTHDHPASAASMWAIEIARMHQRTTMSAASSW
jgi:hypothetical protein